MTTASPAPRRALRQGWRFRCFARFLLGGTCVFAGARVLAADAPPVAKMLGYQPRHDVAITTPAPAEHASCKVELVKGKVGTGWALKDGQGNLVRRFSSTDGRNIDNYSYFKDGVEVYREVVSTGAKAPDQFRWLNAGGSKWGVDEDKNGTIDAWKAISAEEVSQEVLNALATRNVQKLEACMITEEDMRTLGLPTEMVEDLKAKRKGVKAKFDATLAKLTKLTDKATWLHLETGAPQCLPADQTGARADLVRHARATVLFDAAGSSDWFQLGTLILVGNAWKVTDAPTVGAATSDDKSDVMDIGKDPKLQAMVEKLTELDKKAVGASGAAAVKHHLDRADILEQIVAAVKPTERDPWIRQVADSLSSAMQATSKGDATASGRLTSLEKQLTQHVAGSSLTGYVVFRRLQAEYAVKLTEDPKKFQDVQKDWLDKLTAFVKAYPKAEDTPDAILQLGMVCEVLGKEVEAKNWYAQLAKTFADKPQAAKGAGAALRLDLEGQPVTLTGPLLADGNKTASLEQMRGKTAVVYYWASWNAQAAGDFAKLKALVEGSKGEVALLCVNLDNTPEEAKAFLAKNPLPGTHLHQAGGVDSKLATQYGIMGLPTTFVVGKDGKCLSKSAQVSTLEEEIKKQQEEKSEKKK